MGFFKTLAYVAGGAVLAPITGGSSLLVGIAAATAAGAAVNHVKGRIEESKDMARAEGRKAGEAIASQKFEEKAQNFASRLSQYHDMDQKIVAMYAVGLAIANADGNISATERQELDEFVAGCVAGHFPDDVKATISSLSSNPPNLTRALEFARTAGVPKDLIDEIIDLVANADDDVSPEEQKFIEKWQFVRVTYDTGVRDESVPCC